MKQPEHYDPSVGERVRETFSLHAPSIPFQIARVAGLVGGTVLLGVAVTRRSKAALLGAAAAIAGPLLARSGAERWNPSPRPSRMRSAPITARSRFTIRADARKIYDFWRHPTRVPEVLGHIQQVEELSDIRSRWVARGPGGTVEWVAEIVEDRPGEVLAWRSVEGSDLRQAGRLELSEAAPGRGVEVFLEMGLEPPAGSITTAVAGLLEPLVERTIEEDLRRSKHLLEAGEVPTNSPQPHGERALLSPHNPF